MNKKKQQGNQQQTQSYQSTYNWERPPITPEVQNVIDEANSPAQIDPSIAGIYGNISNQILNSYNDPFGAKTTQAVREKSLRSNLLKVGTERAKAQNQAYWDAKNTGFSRKVTAAGMTAPQLVQTGGSSNANSTSNMTQSGGFWSSIIPSLVSGATA